MGPSNCRLKLDAGGKPSTWFPPGGLVEHHLLQTFHKRVIVIFLEVNTSVYISRLF